MYPAFSFARVIYNLTYVCAEQNCYTSFSDVDKETMTAMASLYIYGLVYMLLGTYFNEIIK